MNLKLTESNKFSVSNCHDASIAFSPLVGCSPTLRQMVQEARHQHFTRVMTFHFREPLESNAASFSKPFDLSLEVGTSATKFVRVLDFAILALHSRSSSLHEMEVNQLGQCIETETINYMAVGTGT